jgi:hypothetical protein
MEIAESFGVDDEGEFLLTQRVWDPYRFVDLCEIVQQSQSPAIKMCRHVARAEWQLLFDFCFQQALSSRVSK